MSKIILNLPDSMHNVFVMVDASTKLSPGYSILWKNDFQLLPGDIVSVNVVNNDDK